MTALLVGALTRSLRTPDGGTVYQVDTHRTARTVSALQRRGLVVMEARTVIADDDGREYERVTSWLTEEGARVARRLAGEAQQEDDSDLITRKPTAYMVELLRKGAADAEGRMTVADHNDRTQDGLLRRGMADVVSAGLWMSYLVITERGRAYLARVDGAQQERVRPVAPVRKAGPFAGALVEMARREGVVAPEPVRGPFAGALDAMAAREAVSAPVAAGERPEVPEVPVSAAPRSLADAAAFLGSLKVGERVRVTREGRTADLTVSMGPRRADGAFGSVGSTRVTVS
ncbi:hypothetical protein, partial [Streptomyces griseoaurantiacus]|uniref:hypothetical protein n=1 Tax=Streptomyces griseoaurantiacus TaxID=68213 RepID=UPI0036C7F973